MEQQITRPHRLATVEKRASGWLKTVSQSLDGKAFEIADASASPTRTAVEIANTVESYN